MATIKGFKADVSSINPLSEQMVKSIWQRAGTWNVSFETLYGGQFMLSTQLIIPNYPVILSHWCSTTVSIETYLFITTFSLSHNLDYLITGSGSEGAQQALEEVYDKVKNFKMSQQAANSLIITDSGYYQTCCWYTTGFAY